MRSVQVITVLVGVALGGFVLAGATQGQSGSVVDSAGAAGKATTSADRDPIDRGDPLAREQALVGTTGRLIVKFKDDAGIKAPAMDAPFPVFDDAADPFEAMAVEAVLLESGGTMRRWIDEPESVLLDIMARAEANSGRPQPDLRAFAYVDVPIGRWFATLEALRALDTVEWATFERTVVVAQDGQGCGGPLTPPCEFPNPNCGIGAVGDCNPDPGCNLDPPACEFGCSDAVCCARVVSILPSCSDPDAARGWDQYCATIANILCATNQSGPSTGPYRPCFNQDGLEPYGYFLSSPCWMARGSGRVGCNDTDCCLRVCEIDPFCCTLEWDSACVELASGNGVDTVGVCFDAPDPGAQTPDFTASVVSVIEEREDGTTYQAFRARGLQTYTVGAPVVGFPDDVVIPDPPKPGMEFLETGFKGWGLDLEQVSELQLIQRGESGSEAFLYGASIRVGVVDFAYIPHEEFTCEVQAVGGGCRQPYAVPRVIPEEGQTQLDDLPATEKWHGTACLGMLVAGDNGFGITGIAKNAQGYFYPIASAEQGFRLQNAVISMVQDFEAGDVCLLPVALSPDGGVGPNELFSQPITLNPAYRSLLDVAVDLGVTCVVPAGNDSAEVLAEEAPGVLVVGASYPGALISNGGETGAGIAPFSRHPTSNFTTANTIDLFAWGSDLVTTGGFPDLFNGGPNRTYTKSFGGTSGAATMIAGATAVLSGAAKQRFFGLPASPILLERVMRNNGLPQQGQPFSGGKQFFLGARLRTDGNGGQIADFPDIYLGGIDEQSLQARLGFSAFNRANFVQLVDAANDLFLEADDCLLAGIQPPPDQIGPFGPDGEDDLEIEINLAGGVGDTGDNCPWTAFSNVPWIVTVVGSGTGAELSNNAVFEVLPNAETSEPRTGEITIIGGNATTVITIVQAGCVLVGTVPDPVVYPAGGDENVDIELLFNGESCAWTAETLDPWLVLLSDTGTGEPFDNRIELDVLPNNETEGPREGLITVSTASGEAFDVVVTQEPCGLIGVDPPAPVFGPDGDEESDIELQWNGDGCTWTAVSEVPWIELIIDSGTGTPFENILRYEVLGNNDTQVPREGTIVVTSGAGTEFDLTVTQAPCTLVDSVPPAPAFGPDGIDEADIELIFDGEVCGWTATSESPWIELIIDSGTGTPFENILRYEVLGNNDTQAPREGTIVVTTSAGTEFDLTVTQAPCTLVDSVPPAPAFGPDGIDEADIELIWDGSVCGWTATSEVPWIELIVDSGTGEAFDNELSYRVLPNLDLQLPREGTIVVTSAAGTEFDLIVTQAPCTLVDTVPGLAPVVGPDGVDEAEFELIWDGELCGWTAEADVPWIAFQTGAGTGAPFDNILRYSVGPNGETIAPRDGTITVVSSAGTEFELPIEQFPCAIDTFDPPAFTGPFEIDFPGAFQLDGLVNLTGETCEWTATANAPWIQMLQDSGTGAPGENVFSFNVQANSSSAQRTAQIVFTGSNGATDSIVVRQAAFPDYTSAYQVVSGFELTTEDVSRLLVPDNVAVRIESQLRSAGATYSGLAYPNGGWATDLYMITTYDPPTWVEGEEVQLNSLQVELRTRTNSLAILRYVYLRNRSTGQWTFIASDFPLGQAYPQNPPWDVLPLPDYLNAFDFVDTTTGRVDVRVLTFGGATTANHWVEHDLVRVVRVQDDPEGLVDGGGLEVPDLTGWNQQADADPSAGNGRKADHGADGSTPAASLGLNGATLGPDPVEGRFLVGVPIPDVSSCTLRSDSPWLWVDPRVKTLDDGRVEIRYRATESNRGPTPRSAMVELVVEDGSTFKVPFIQVACELETTEPLSIEVGGQGTVGAMALLPWNGDSCEWQASSDADWLRFTPMGLAGEGSHQLAVDVMANPSTFERQATVRIESPHRVVAEIDVLQQGRHIGDPGYEVRVGREVPPSMPSLLERADGVPIIVDATAEPTIVHDPVATVAGRWITDVLVRAPVGTPDDHAELDRASPRIINVAGSSSEATTRVVYVWNHRSRRWDYAGHDVMPVSSLGRASFALPSAEVLEHYVDAETELVSVRILTFGSGWSYTVFHDSVEVFGSPTSTR